MERIPNSPEYKRFGRNVEIHAIFVRHGEKDEKGNLIDKGKEQASYFGKKLENSDAIKAYSSPVQRVVETVEQIIKNSPHDKKLKTRLKTEISIPQISQETYKKIKELGEKGDDEATEWFLNFGSKKPDAETTSPYEVAESFAYVLTKYLRMTDKIYSGSNIDLIHGTHQMLPEALLKEVLIRKFEDKNIVGFEKLDDIGGALKFTEGMEFFIKTDEFGNKKINVKFRDQVYDIDMSKLDELAKSYAEKQNEK